MQTITIENLDKPSYFLDEAYKTLRTNLAFCGKSVKVIAMTSCIPNEGKTSISMNLCRTIAESGKSVLFIDADMRKSVISGRYNLTGAVYGLSHYLSETKELKDVLYQTNINNFYMITSGPVPPNPSELLSNDVFKGMVSAAREKFDYIIIDCPPIGSVTDAAVVSQVADGIALVLMDNEISYKFAQDVKAQLEKTGVKILGVIVNKVRIGKRRGYYGKYYGGKYYGKYYGRYYGKYYGKYYGNYYGKEEGGKKK